MKIHRIQGIGFSSYLLESPDALFLVDSGFRWFERLILMKIRALGRDLGDLRLAVLTHPHLDHVGSVPALLERSDFEIAAHPRAELALADGGREFSPPTQPWGRAVQWLATNGIPLLKLPGIKQSVRLGDGERLDRFGLEATAYYTPGHSEWCVSLVLDDGTAFVGDLATGPGHMSHGVALPAMAIDQATGFESMQKLLKAGVKRFMPAHGRAFSADELRAMLGRLHVAAAPASPARLAGTTS